MDDRNTKMIELIDDVIEKLDGQAKWYTLASIHAYTIEHELGEAQRHVENFVLNSKTHTIVGGNIVDAVG